MRWSPLVVVLALAVSACFAELPDVPVGSSGGSGGSSGGGASTSTGELGATTMPTMAATEADSQDVPTGVIDPTTGEPPEGEGLFACDAVRPCDAWTLPKCPGPCSLDAAGTCVLERMRDQAQGALRVRQCDGDCTLDAMLLRGSGSPVLRRQRAMVGPDEVLQNYQPPVMCQLRSSDFFAGCLEAFTAACADPEQWLQDCGPTDVHTCADAGGG